MSRIKNKRKIIVCIKLNETYFSYQLNNRRKEEKDSNSKANNECYMSTDVVKSLNRLNIDMPVGRHFCLEKSCIRFFFYEIKCFVYFCVFFCLNIAKHWIYFQLNATRIELRLFSYIKQKKQNNALAMSIHLKHNHAAIKN